MSEWRNHCSYHRYHILRGLRVLRLWKTLLLIRKPNRLSISSYFYRGKCSVAGCVLGTLFPAIYMGPKHMDAFLWPQYLHLINSTATRKCPLCFTIALGVGDSRGAKLNNSIRESQAADREAAWARIYLRIMETEQVLRTVLNFWARPLGKQVSGFLWFLTVKGLFQFFLGK